ncbi:MAG: hypothetical protein GY725_08065 [bacterium]|nr:hypothetical protein [bacterium]
MFFTECARRIGIIAAFLLSTVFLALPPFPVSAEETTVEEIVSILREKGLIDEAQETQLLDRHMAERATSPASVAAGISKGIEFTGDLRLRHETSWQDTNANGLSKNDDRYRFRYRARIGFKKRINPWAKVGMRLASGSFENDSTNRSAGTEVVASTTRDRGEDFDFGNDPLFIDRVWAEFKLPTGEIDTKLVAGKVGNPFIWKNGKDLLLWDRDISPEGLYFKTSLELNDVASVFATVGGFDVDENSSKADGMLYAGQFGCHFRPGGSTKAGIRASLYQWKNLDADNVARAVADGNTAAQTFDLNASGIGDAKIGEISGYLTLAGLEDWPVTIYGTFAQNFDAQSIGAADKDEDAYSFGFETGNKKKWGKIGIGYFYAETNSLIANFIDSDVLDSNTNRKGIMVYASKRLGNHVVLKLTYFDSDEISAGVGSGSNSLDGADRKRLNSDIVLKF